ncbi:unnamed protein product [Sphagnum troendelagicum]|uniref:Uncharacterized protein n=1 Tax=Sphagnum troendelagicum TaxID=128251 RepID=A0ABP0UBX7_9BRYO
MAGELEENNVVRNAKEGPDERLKSDKEVAGNKEEYDSGMTSKASGGLDFMGLQLQGKVPTERQSSINMEPLTLDDNVMHDAKGRDSGRTSVKIQEDSKGACHVSLLCIILAHLSFTRYMWSIKSHGGSLLLIVMKVVPIPSQNASSV